MKNFIIGLKQLIVNNIVKIKGIHKFLSTTTELEMYTNWKQDTRTLYSVFFGWLLENLWYGLIISVSLIMFNVQFRWYLPFTIASLYWICLDTIDRITKIIRK